jgi:hypothetical protein
VSPHERPALFKHVPPAYLTWYRTVRKKTKATTLLKSLMLKSPPAFHPFPTSKQTVSKKTKAAPLMLKSPRRQPNRAPFQKTIGVCQT